MITALAALAVAACPAIGPDAPVVLAVTSADPELLGSRAGVRRRLEALAKGRLQLLPEAATIRALSVEGGAEARARAELEARVRLEQAEARFRELDDEAALAGAADVIARLASVHQTEEARRLLAQAHLLAAAIYLARGEIDAARSRLVRALDLDSDITAPRHRYDPRLLAELAAAKSSRALRPVGRLVVERADAGPATVFLDGRPLGETPLFADAVPEGRHLLLVQAPGRRSVSASIRIEAQETTRRRVHLPEDPEHAAMQALAGQLRASADPTPSLALLARRAGAEHALVAELVLAPTLSPVGTATVAVRLWSSHGGRGFSADTRAENLAVALGQTLACAHAPFPPLAAPALLGAPDPRTVLAPVPRPEPWWRAPWVWAVAAGVALGAAGALVAARANAGPADALSITLVPRP